ncbi:sce7725 family protein [Vibrio gazogenes]|uniref:Sce7725 family protein n=1 Tax=Vibrio gazogenes DSM 21264 = NBRC 103151 TaxID=1123492 RepID=A0A1M5FT38_VIBGA|nr:sce7725 family protein [Vibrio gazogenes]USP13541.1 sce7725 family protein [Vibrio gazogenes]SHF94663.1 hypothetical protein SAMN02745781_03573 [Vibrio gazogenes DSM 21264] [Vibrio gazogenes DSM 21264 = NBRC 103151]SJN54855.1 hypothetical protein BQ6471_01242 [Vibrio gazogenes]
MYYPVLRGKQFELICLRELSPIIKCDLWCPIIEPVRQKLQGLTKTIEYLNQNQITPIVITNPSLGDFDGNLHSIEEKLLEINTELQFKPCFSTKNRSSNELKEFTESHQNTEFAIFIEDGVNKNSIHLIEKASLVISKKYQRGAFRNLSNVVIVEDNFPVVKNNSSYPDKSYFSDRHTDYKEGTNVVGYGDYTITGSDYLESGGPAYVVAIHLSYIDPDEYHSMFIKHFKSYDDNSPTRPGEKFGDALQKLIQFCDAHPMLVQETLGLKGFRELKTRDHFPGLGQAKKLSIQHHIHTLCMYGEK